jgi:hypothetical protein
MAPKELEEKFRDYVSVLGVIAKASKLTKQRTKLP